MKSQYSLFRHLFYLSPQGSKRCGLGPPSAWVSLEQTGTGSDMRPWGKAWGKLTRPWDLENSLARQLQISSTAGGLLAVPKVKPLQTVSE